MDRRTATSRKDTAMSGEIDIYEMAMKVETMLRDRHIERARLRNERDAPSTVEIALAAPVRGGSAWTMRLLHIGTPSRGRASGRPSPGSVSPGDAIS